MRANEFINEGLWDTIKQKAGTAGSAIAKTATNVGKGIGQAATTVGKNLLSNQPALQRATAKKSTQIFMKEFLETLKATQIQQEKQGKPFTLAKFVNAYMKQYGWTPGEYEAQLKQVVNANDPQKLAVVMDKIGTVNAAAKKSTEKAMDIDGDGRIDPQMGQATDGATPQQAQQSKIGVKQINQIIPKLRTRDLNSVKKTVDNTLASKTGGGAPTVGATANPMGSMASQLTGQNPMGKTRKTKTGTVTNVPGGIRHSPKTSNPNLNTPYNN